MTVIEELKAAIVVGNAARAASLVEQAIADGMKPSEIINSGLIAGMEIVGDKWKNGEYFIPNVLISARAMQGSMHIVKPHLKSGDLKSSGVAVAGTVKGDLHDIGKNLVVMMMEGAGFEVLNLGTDVSPEKFVQAAKEKKADLLCMSALLTTTMPVMKVTIDALRQAGLRDKVKVMVGGAAVTQKFAGEIGADGYAADATAAVEKAKKLLSL